MKTINFETAKIYVDIETAEAYLDHEDGINYMGKVSDIEAYQEHGEVTFAYLPDDTGGEVKKQVYFMPNQYLGVPVTEEDFTEKEGALIYTGIL